MTNEHFFPACPRQVTAIGSDYVPKLPDDVAIIVINGNSNQYGPDARYDRFRGCLVIRIDSQHTRPKERFHPQLTDDVCRSIIKFSEEHIDVPLIVQCSYGEQRSQGLAMGLYHGRQRTLFDIPEYPCNASVYDQSVLMAIKSHLSKQRLNTGVMAG